MNDQHHLVPAALPLAVLQAVQDLDAPAADGLDEFHEDLSAKRLGLSETVASQIDRFNRLARGGADVDAEQLVALFRLVGRRPDAALVFSDAGRRAGHHAVMESGKRMWLGLLPGGTRRRAGFRLARQRARLAFGLRLTQPDNPAATLEDRLPVVATDDGTACAFYGAGLAEILRRLIDFEGAMMHTHCRGRGDIACEWHALLSGDDEKRS